MAMLWQEIGWVDVEAYLKKDDRAIVPVGSCEQHGRHLSFATDYLVPMEIGRRVSALTRVPVTPPLCFGMSVHHMEFPGTISLSPDTFVAVVRDILQSLYRHGFRRIMLINGHGGNVNPLGTALAPLLDQHRDLRVKIGNWWVSPEAEQVMKDLWGAPDHHATAAETSAIMAIQPSIPKMARAAFSPWSGDLEVKGPRHWKRLFPHGATGLDPALATREAGERLLAVVAKHYARELETWADL